MGVVPNFPDKDPGDRLDYTVDFTKVFETGESIASSTWTISPTGTGHLVNEAESDTAVKSTITLSGGQNGTTYTLTLSVTTNKGTPVRIFERDFRLRVRNL